MEAAFERDDEARGSLFRSMHGVRPGALRLDAGGGALAGVKARQLDGAFVGLGARVREERLPGGLVGLRNRLVQQAGQQAGHFAAVFHVVIVAHMHELFGLQGQRRGHGRVAVAQADRADAADEVEVFAAFVVEHRHAAAPHQLHGLAGERAHDIGRLEALFRRQAHKGHLS